MIASSALSRAYAIIYQTNPIYLYSLIYKTTPILPPITIFWTPIDAPAWRAKGYVDYLSHPTLKLLVGHRIYLQGHMVGRVIAISRTTNPNQVRVTLRFQIHRLGYEYITLWMPAKLAGEIREY